MPGVINSPGVGLCCSRKVPTFQSCENAEISEFYTGILHQGILENVFPRLLDVPARDNPKEVEMILSVENLTQFPSSILKTRIFYVPLLQICLFKDSFNTKYLLTQS